MTPGISRGDDAGGGCGGEGDSRCVSVSQLPTNISLGTIERREISVSSKHRRVVIYR